MRIAQISDLHFTHLTWNPLRLFSKRIFGNLNWIFSRKSKFQKEQVDLLPDLFKSLGVDLVLIGGDFTTTALHEEYLMGKEFVQKLSQNWIAIPGNHDHYTYRSHRGKHFYKHLANKRKEITHPLDFFQLSRHGVEAHKIAPNWWVVALDTAQATNPHSSRGLFSEKTEGYLAEVLSLLPPEDSVICLNHYPFFQHDEPRRNLLRGRDLRALLSKYPNVRLYLHGHTHRHSIADLQANHLPIILDSGSCAQGAEGTWNLIDLMPDHCSLTAYRFGKTWEPFRQETMQWMK